MSPEATIPSETNSGAPKRMDSQTEMILRMMSDLREAIIQESNTTRMEFRETTKIIMAKQDLTNGRVNQLEKDVARIDERTSEMNCVEHTSVVRNLSARINTVEDTLDDVADSITKNNERLTVVEEATGVTTKRNRVAKFTISAGAIAGIIALFEGLWTWLKDAPSWLRH